MCDERRWLIDLGPKRNNTYDFRRCTPNGHVQLLQKKLVSQIFFWTTFCFPSRSDSNFQGVGQHYLCSRNLCSACFKISLALYEKVFIHPPNRMGKVGVSSVEETPTDTKYVTN